MRFATLASGSSGNASYVEADGFGVLIDFGLGPRQIEDRLAKMGVTWAQVRAVLLSHTHGDHWHHRTLALMHRQKIPLYCHEHHQRVLMMDCMPFADLSAANLVLAYEPDEAFLLAPRLSCLPFRVQHDSGVTCGFRLEGPPDMFGEPVALAYASDLGMWDEAIAEVMANVDVLAVEFNHDVALQQQSRRSQWTIARNLGNKGHLSNEQAAALVNEVLQRSAPQRLQHIVQLHLSRECNNSELAVTALHGILNDLGEPPLVHSARQDNPGPMLTLGDAKSAKRQPRRKPRGEETDSSSEPQYTHSRLPGLEDGASS